MEALVSSATRRAAAVANSFDLPTIQESKVKRTSSGAPKSSTLSPI
jgi:hypothetical protein